MSSDSDPLYVRVRDPMTKAEAGALGARKRWGEPRVLRLDSLSPPARRLILAMVAADEAARAEADAPPDPRAA